MKNPKMRILNYIIAGFNILLSALCYPFLPEQIPMHWDLNGTVAYQNKSHILILCGTVILLAVLLDMLPRIDPRRENYQKFFPYYDGFCIVMELFMLMMTGVTLTESFRPGTVSVPMTVMLAVGILLTFIGNILPKVKSNFYIGIKTPWAISSEEVWRKTHRLGGKCFFAAGILMILSAFVPQKQVAFYVTFTAIMVCCLIPAAMSYVWWRRESKES